MEHPVNGAKENKLAKGARMMGMELRYGKTHVQHDQSLTSYQMKCIPMYCNGACKTSQSRDLDGQEDGDTHSLGSGGGNDDAVLHGVVLLKRLHKLGDRRTLLADGDVDNVKLQLLVVALVPPPLVQHSVESDGGLAGLTITDDQLTLTTANRHHGVDGLETGLHGLVDGAAGQDAGSLHTGTALLGGLDGALAVDGVAEGVNNTAEELSADGNIDLDIALDTLGY